MFGIHVKKYHFSLLPVQCVVASVVVIFISHLCMGPVYSDPNDKLEIIREVEMKTDSSDSFITIPEDYPEVRDFTVASTAPAIDFAIIQGIEPFYVASSGVWGGWGDVTKGPDGCFYFGIGNHQAYGAQAYVIKYDPFTRTQSLALSSRETVGWDDDDFGDGKLHGDPDVDPDGNMWLLTFFGPEPSEKVMGTAYKGSHLLQYNIFTGESEDLGIPLENEGWPYHAYDWERGVLFGVGEPNRHVLAYDTRQKKVLYGGPPPDGIHWYRRCVLLDRETGKIYSNDVTEDSDHRPVNTPHPIVSWERHDNKFTVLESYPPPNPVTGKLGPIRAHTKRKDKDGAFWCFDFYGTFFKFYPEQDRVELVGVNWGESGKYTSSMSFSPQGRYIYYLPGADTKAYRYGTPVVQYDTETDQKKVIAFLNDFYMDKYGYSPGGTYGLELDEKGETLLFYTNGVFTSSMSGGRYGRPALFHLRIPASERVENPLTVVAERREVPRAFSLRNIYPNPFNPSTTIRYDVPQTGVVSLRIYDATGQRVKTLVSDYRSPGSYEVSWNGTNEQGTFVSTGMYLAKLEAGEFTEMKKILLLK